MRNIQKLKILGIIPCHSLYACVIFTVKFELCFRQWERWISRSLYCLKWIYSLQLQFRVNYRPTCRGEKVGVPYAFVSFAATDLTYMSSLEISQSASNVPQWVYVEIQFLSQCQSKLALWAYNYVTCRRSGSWVMVAKSDIIPMSLLLSG